MLWSFTGLYTQCDDLHGYSEPVKLRLTRIRHCKAFNTPNVFLRFLIFTKHLQDSAENIATLLPRWLLYYKQLQLLNQFIQKVEEIP